MCVCIAASQGIKEVLVYILSGGKSVHNLLSLADIMKLLLRSEVYFGIAPCTCTADQGCITTYPELRQQLVIKSQWLSAEMKTLGTEETEV